MTIVVVTRELPCLVAIVGDIYLQLAVDRTTPERIQPGDKIPSEEAVDFTRIAARLEGLSSTADSLARDVNALFGPENRRQMESPVSNTNRAVVSGSASLQRVASGLKSATFAIAFQDGCGLVSGHFGEGSKARGPRLPAGPLSAYDESSWIRQSL
ncbi:MAG: hypothetical protein ACM3ON_03860 [Chloroflexota bacterium]